MMAMNIQLLFILKRLVEWGVKQEVEMRYLANVISVLFFIGSVCAQDVDISALDSAARSARGQSVLFKRPLSQEEQDAAKAKREAEEAAEKARREALRPVNLFGNELKIYAEVNGEVITSRDMQNRVNAFVATTKIPVNAQTKKMIIEKVLQAAVDEKLKLQEAEKNGVNITEADLNEGLKNFAKENKTSVRQVRQMLRQAGVTEEVFRSQMKAEMAWSRLVGMKARREINISESEVRSALDMINQDKMKQKYLISEIVISQKKAKNIYDLVENLRNDPRFELYAMQFSESPSARGGGNLGWVGKDQLAEPLIQALEKMKVGQISQPVKVGTDYYILKLQSIYRPGIDKAPSTNEQEVRQLLQSQKTEALAQKYIRDLRNKAVIERRV